MQLVVGLGKLRLGLLEGVFDPLSYPFVKNSLLVGQVLHVFLILGELDIPHLQKLDFVLHHELCLYQLFVGVLQFRLLPLQLVDKLVQFFLFAIQLAQ